MAKQKKNIQDYLDALVDKEGLKTDVKITLTDESLWKLIGGLFLAGVSIALVANVLKNIIPNKHLAKQTQILLRIKDQLKPN